jgi:prolyl-tRNA synthetase
VVEAHHDANGIIWPRAIAPFDAALLTLGPEPAVAELADRASALSCSASWP